MKVFSVGLFRSGTTTMWEMFARSFRADHEFQVQEEMDVFERRLKDSITDDEARAFIRERDAAKPLDLDSCGAHFGVLDILADEYPEAKFILTLRDVYSWMNSCVGKMQQDFVGGWGSRAGTMVNCFNFLPDGGLFLEDRSQSKMCLEQMMKLWTWHTRRIQGLVPADRLLIVKTEELSQSVERIASFCGVEPGLIDSLHSNPGPSTNFLACFDAERLEELVQLHCGELMFENYPGVTLACHTSRAWSDAPADCAELSRYFALDEFVNTEFVQTRIPSY